MRISVILATNWWSLILRGGAAILLGLVTLVRPSMPLKTIALIFFAYALIDGLAGIAGALRAAQGRERWSPLLLDGITGIAAAAALAIWPAVFEPIPVIAAWALVTGVLEIIAAVELRRSIAGERLFLLSALSSLFLGAVTAAIPLTSPVRFARLLGVCSLIFGALLCGLGVRLRSEVADEVSSSARNKSRRAALHR